MVAITQFNRDHIFDAVKLMYTSVANQPERKFHFPTGRSACEFVGYPKNQLDKITPTALESFAGVGYPFASGVIKKGDDVLDIGAGSGTDALLSALLAGPTGMVYGLDMTKAMHEKLFVNKDKMGLENVTPLFGNAEEIPLEDETVDVVTSNGVLNLVPDKEKSFAEIFRVMKHGGHIQISDIIIHKNSTALDASKANPKLWAECIVGAMEQDAYIESFNVAGFNSIRVIGELDYFSGSENEATRNTATKFGASSITIVGEKAG
ncbi:MAG: methyltransferase domain-containing protein [Acidiferrobacterales bacterium]